MGLICPGLLIFWMWVVWNLRYFIFMASRSCPFCTAWVYGALVARTLYWWTLTLVSSPHTLSLSYWRSALIFIPVAHSASQLFPFFFHVFSSWTLLAVIIYMASSLLPGFLTSRLPVPRGHSFSFGALVRSNRAYWVIHCNSPSWQVIPWYPPSFWITNFVAFLAMIMSGIDLCHCHRGVFLIISTPLVSKET